MSKRIGCRAKKKAIMAETNVAIDALSMVGNLVFVSGLTSFLTKSCTINALNWQLHSHRNVSKKILAPSSIITARVRRWASVYPWELKSTVLWKRSGRPIWQAIELDIKWKKYADSVKHSNIIKLIVSVWRIFLLLRITTPCRPLATNERKINNLIGTPMSILSPDRAMKLSAISVQYWS